MTTLLLADISKGKLGDATAKSLTAARALGEPVEILVAGRPAQAVAAEAAALEGVSRVLLAEDDIYSHGLPEPLAALVVSLAANYAAIVASATSTGKNVAPRIAALLDVMQVSEVTKVLSSDTFERPIYAGNAIQTVQATDALKVLTIRTSAFAATASTTTSAPVIAAPSAGDVGLSIFKGAAASETARPELTSAKVVVSGGRALQSAENFETYLAPLADRLGAAIGASRAAVDAGYAPNDWQVGQTGKIVAPDLYIAVGISGAIQHLAGMKDSKVIVAINKDEDAPIFQVADYGLVQDLFTALPELASALAKPAD